jgi:hypothetical protein
MVCGALVCGQFGCCDHPDGSMARSSGASVSIRHGVCYGGLMSLELTVAVGTTTAGLDAQILL